MSGELKQFYSAMSTEQLEELLRLNIQSSESALDGDALLAILDVLEEREKAAGEFVDDSAEMWNKFCSDHLPDAESGSLYGEFDVAATEISNDERSDSSSAPAPADARRKRKRRVSPVLRAAIIALVFGVLLTGVVSVTAYAAGYDIWGIVGQWTAGTFRFVGATSPESSEPPATEYEGEYKSVQEALDAHGITEPLAPTWLPDGYALNKLIVTARSSRTSLLAEYLDSAGRTITMSITQYHSTETKFSTHEKDDSDVTTYTVGGIEHFIFTNIDRTSIAWFTDNCECSINGELTLSEAQQIIESIYKTNDMPSGEYATLQDALDAYGISEKLAPKWLPEDYSLVELSAEPSVSGLLTVFAAYTSPSGEITILIEEEDGTPNAVYESDDGSGSEYSIGGTTHYLMTNMGRQVAVWINGKYVVSIFGDVTRGELEQILGSIYSD